MLAKFNPIFYGNKNKLTFWITCGPDDQFSSPKQIRWSAALGKLLVIQNTVSGYIGLRNFDLSFDSKYGNYAIAVGADATNLYHANSTVLYKRSLYNIAVSNCVIGNGSIRMIDASGDPDYVYVTSNNATDGHGVRKVRKSDMTVVASLLATGSGDGQFNNPLGVKYYGGFVYVADDNKITKLNASDLSFVSTPLPIKLPNGNAPGDLDFDGASWYVTGASRIYKYNSDFSSSSNVIATCYSICIIPDQGDGNGQTLAITDSNNNHIARYRCDTLAQVGSDVGSSGDGSSSLFDPTFTTSKATTITYTMDDGFTYTTPSGTSHALSWNGFAGYTWRNSGPHRCTVRVNGGLGLVISVIANADAITRIINTRKCLSCSTFYVYDNTDLDIDLSEIPTADAINLSSCSKARGSISALRSAGKTMLRLQAVASVTGALTDLNPLCIDVFLNGCTGITPGSIAHLTAIRDIRIYSMWPTLAAMDSVDIVIDSVYAARANFTYSTGPSMQIGGTNPSPTGNYTNPTVTPGDGNSNSDWSWDGTKHVPLTPKAKIYYLVNGPDHGTDTFYRWSITYTL